MEILTEQQLMDLSEKINNNNMEELNKNINNHTICGTQCKINIMTINKINIATKTQLKGGADNLMYEYIIGRYINTLLDKYSCFIQTYNIFKLNENIVNIIPDGEIDEDIKTGNLNTKYCNLNANLHLNIQYIKGDTIRIFLQHIPSKRDKGYVSEREDFYQNHLLYILFQIYMPLYDLSKTKSFSHNDLHTNNIMIYDNITPVTFTYNLRDGMVEFQTRYIAKIIDYGRSYFENTKNTHINCDNNFENNVYFNNCQDLYLVYEIKQFYEQMLKEKMVQNPKLEKLFEYIDYIKLEKNNENKGKNVILKILSLFKNNNISGFYSLLLKQIASPSLSQKSSPSPSPSQKSIHIITNETNKSSKKSIISRFKKSVRSIGKSLRKNTITRKSSKTTTKK